MNTNVCFDSKLLRVSAVCVKRVGEYIKPIMTVTTPIRNFENSDPFKRSLNCWLKSIK